MNDIDIPYWTLPLAGALLLAAGGARAQLGQAPVTTQAVTAQGASSARLLGSKLGDQLSLMDFGAACDSSSDDTGAVVAAQAVGRPVAIPAGRVCNVPGLGQYTIGATLTGPGKVRTSDGNLRGPRYGAVSAPPNPSAMNSTNSGNVNSSFGLSTWANFDYSHALSAEEFHVSGSATLGQPASGYFYMPGTAAHTSFFDNTSGWNQSTSGNGGRTGAVFDQVIAQQSGQGDLIVRETELLCGGPAKAGGTNFLANPACAVDAGDIGGLTSGQYLQREEFHISDGGGTSAAMGRVMGYTRTQGTGTKNEYWEDRRTDCNGGSPTSPGCDGVETVTGTWRIGIDFTPTNTHVVAPLAMQAGQRITLNGTNSDNNGNPANAALGGDWLGYDATSATVQLGDNGAPVAQFSNAAGAVNYWSVSGAAAGSAVTLAAKGGDTAITPVLADKGGAGVVQMSNGQVVSIARAPAAAGSYLLLQPGVAGTPFAVQAVGSSLTDLTLQGSAGGAVHPVGTLMLDMATPASSSASCRAGQTTFDGNYAYFCVAANTWKRTALASW